MTAAGRVAHFEDQRLDALARLVLLAGDLLAAGHDALDAAEVDDHRAALEAGDRAGDDRADAVLVFFVDAAALVLADELDHDLLGRLARSGLIPSSRSLRRSGPRDMAGQPIDRDHHFVRCPYCLRTADTIACSMSEKTDSFSMFLSRAMLSTMRTSSEFDLLDLSLRCGQRPDYGSRIANCGFECRALQPEIRNQQFCASPYVPRFATAAAAQNTVTFPKS